MNMCIQGAFEMTMALIEQCLGIYVASQVVGDIAFKASAITFHSIWLLLLFCCGCLPFISFMKDLFEEDSFSRKWGEQQLAELRQEIVKLRKKFPEMEFGNYEEDTWTIMEFDPYYGRIQDLISLKKTTKHFF